MKKLIALCAVAATLAPQAAMAQRHTTPGTQERHEAAQAKARGELAQTEERSERLANNETERQPADHINASKAGKVNTARGVSNGAS